MRDAPASFAPRVSLPPGIWVVILLLLALAGGYCVLLWPEWKQNADLSHGFFAPLVFLVLVRESRRQGPLRWLPAGRSLSFAVGGAMTLGFILFAIAGLLAASVAWTHALVIFVLGTALVSFLFGGLLLLADEGIGVVPFNWISLTAIFLWLLASPIPDGTYARLTLGLQRGVTGGVLNTLQLFGVPARQHGNILELATTTVGVEEACSGIRSLISCIYAGFFFAAWQLRRPGRRLLLIVVAPVLALVMNFIRSLVLTLLANSGRDITGFWHDATGIGILAVTAIILAWLAIVLETRKEPTREKLPPTPAAFPRTSSFGFWTPVALTLALGIFYYTNSRPATNAGRPLPNLVAMLPLHPEGWQVATSKDLYQFSDVLQTTHLLERTYVRPTADGQFVQLTVYVAYWPPGQTTVSRVASHTPDACWPGSGWTAIPVPVSRQTPSLPGLQLSTAEHRIFRSNEGLLQNVWFWHIYDGRAIDYRDPYSVPALLHLALQYGFRRQGDQYFVRLSSNRPWQTLSNEPLVQQIFTQLAAIGL